MKHRPKKADRDAAQKRGWRPHATREPEREVAPRHDKLSKSQAGVRRTQSVAENEKRRLVVGPGGV